MHYIKHLQQEYSMNDIYRIKNIYTKLYSFERDFSEHFDITINEAMILYCLNIGGSKNGNQLSSTFGLSVSRISRLLKGLESKQFIRRETTNADKRVTLFTLNQSGKEKAESIQSQGLPLFDDFRSGLKDLVE